MTAITLNGPPVSLSTLPAQTNASAGTVEFTAEAGQYLFIRAYDAANDYSTDIIIRDSQNNIIFQTTNASPAFNDYAGAGSAPYTVPKILQTGSYAMEVLYTNTWVASNSQPILVYISTPIKLKLGQGKSFSADGLVGTWLYRPVFFQFAADDNETVSVVAPGVGTIESWERKIVTLPWLNDVSITDNSSGGNLNLTSAPLWADAPCARIFWLAPHAAGTYTVTITGSKQAWTWNNYDSGNAWDTPGGDLDATHYVDVALTGADGYSTKAVNITSIVQQWIGGRVPELIYKQQSGFSGTVLTYTGNVGFYNTVTYAYTDATSEELAALADGALAEATPNTNVSGINFVQTTEASGARVRAYNRFPLPNAGKTLQTATLNLKLADVNGSGTMRINQVMEPCFSYPAPMVSFLIGPNVVINTVTGTLSLTNATSATVTLSN